MIKIDVEKLAQWLKSRGTDNLEGNMVLDGLEELYQFETALAKYFKD